MGPGTPGAFDPADSAMTPNPAFSKLLSLARDAYIRDTSRLVGERGHVSALGTYHDAAGQFCPYLAALNLHVINRTNGFGIVTNLKRDAIVVGAEHAVCN